MSGSPRGRDLRCTVLVPVYDMAAYLSAAVQSALDDSLHDIEVLILDDGSTDATPKVAREFTDSESPRYDPRVSYHRRSNRGKAGALNEALPRARGRYVTILDADDELAPGSLSRRYLAGTARRAADGADMVVGGMEILTDQGVIGVRAAPETSDPDTLRRRFATRHRTPFHLNACLLSRELVERVGAFDETLRRCQDIDYSLRCLDAVGSIVVVDEPVYRYRKNRRTTRERVAIRWKTLGYRTRVLWKAFRGPVAPVAVGLGIAWDAAKMLYNLFGDYES